MKQYKVTNPNGLIFYYGGEEKNPKDGDVVELDENHITTRALVERKQIVEVAAKTPKPAKEETPPADESKPEASSKPAKK